MKWINLLCAVVLVSSCRLPDQKSFEKTLSLMDTAALHTVDSNQAIRDTVLKETLPPPRRIKNPDGIYQAVLPIEGKVEQTVVFHSNNTYELQERYTEHKDSLVTTTGNWTPSDGYIWLYKDQLVRGRYLWKGDQLHYFSPSLNKSFAMNRHPDIMENKTWKERQGTGLFLFGVGNEPFWNIEYSEKDTLILRMADWKEPVKLKLTSTQKTADSIQYTAQSDSTSLSLTVFPQFCSDGMSDYIYRNRITVRYKDKVLEGCGTTYK